MKHHEMVVLIIYLKFSKVNVNTLEYYSMIHGSKWARHALSSVHAIEQP